jgi:hypothetical protein
MSKRKIKANIKVTAIKRGKPSICDETEEVLGKELCKLVDKLYGKKANE